METSELLALLRDDPTFTKNVAAWEKIPAHPAQYGEFPAQLDPLLSALLRSKGLTPLYSHQSEAIETIFNHQNVVLVTATASGKSLAYTLPTLQFMLQDPATTALYLFPTKALAQDQSAAFGELIGDLETDRRIVINLYDGDTPQSHRTHIRKEGGIIVSNPDMLHMGILPYHSRWASFFQNLRIVVLDEIHTYRGIFGSHMANVMRRLRRICRFYGSNPIFACTSATIANPQELAQSLLETPVVVIDRDGSPHGEKHLIVYNPPTIDEYSGLRRSYTLETKTIAGYCLAANVQTIIFSRARLTTELLLGYVRDEAERNAQSGAIVRGYRGGYLPLERREIERDLRNGAIHAVVATNALELGVDIGALGAAILAGYPGTIASTWQQFGRAGRRSDTSVGILVASGAPLDQYLASHPRYLFESAPEHALVNPDNLLILATHLRCAAYELPFTDGEAFGLFEDAEEILQLLADSGEVHHSGGVYRWVSDQYPAADVSLRTNSTDTVVIQAQSSGEPIVIGEVDRQSAPIMVYEGAIYLHEGREFQIETLDWENGIAHATETDADYYTAASSGSAIEVEEEYDTGVVGDCVKVHGRVLVRQQTTSYRIVKRYTHETLGYGQINLPPQEFETTAYWVSLTPDLTVQLEALNILLKPNDYGPNWPDQRDKARERDGYRCARCNAPERVDRQHDVHHLTPFREFGYVAGKNEAYREANRLENLQTLCRSCHQAIESARGTRSALSGMGHVVRNIATLLLMCSPNDIGVLAEQRSSHTKAPTITVYDHAAGGMGLSSRLYDLHIELLTGALDLVRDCPCRDGCPACVGPVGQIGADTKQLTIALLEAMTSNLAT